MNEVEKQQIIAEYEAEQKKLKSEHYSKLVGRMWQNRPDPLDRKKHMAKPVYFRKLKLYGKEEAVKWLKGRFDEGVVLELLELWSQ